jgi:phage tail-like protein
MPAVGATVVDDPATIDFRAQAGPTGVKLSWRLPDPAGDPNGLALVIVRRERRFPGRGRRGVIPIQASDADLTDGDTVYDGRTLSVHFEEVRHETIGTGAASVTRQYQLTGEPRDRVLVRTIERELRDGTPTRTTIHVLDHNTVTPSAVYYYTAFIGDDRLYSRRSQAAATASHPQRGRLFAALPRVIQQLDTVEPPARSVRRADARAGQLERFLDVIDAHAGMLEALVDSLRDVHNVRRVDSQLLDALAMQIGWPLKAYLDEDGQRNEISFAPEFYRTVGTSPNLAAMVNRLTGWDARTRDFATSVLLTWDGRRREHLEVGPAYLDGSLTASATTPPTLAGRRLVPAGSVDTTDAQAMYRMRTRAYDDTVVYSFDCGHADSNGGYVLDDDVLHNPGTVGVYVVPDIETEPFVLEQQWRRVRQIIEEFVPINVRIVFVLHPGLAVEEAYDATAQVIEVADDFGHFVEADEYTGGDDPIVDRVPGWIALLTNRLDHRSVDVGTVPAETKYRTWHGWVMPPST